MKARAYSVANKSERAALRGLDGAIARAEASLRVTKEKRQLILRRLRQRLRKRKPRPRLIAYAGKETHQEGALNA